MPDAPENDLAILVAQEVAKQLPLADIYKDGFAPATQETGGLFVDVIKCVRLSLAPVQYGAVLQDRFRRFIEISAARVPEAQRVAPVPQILGPVLKPFATNPRAQLAMKHFQDCLAEHSTKRRLDKPTRPFRVFSGHYPRMNSTCLEYWRRELLKSLALEFVARNRH